MLFAAACAYKVPGARTKDNKHHKCRKRQRRFRMTQRNIIAPTTFSERHANNRKPKHGGRGDVIEEITMDFTYQTPDGTREMRWRRGKGWSRSFFGRKGAEQPLQHVYLRTLSNLSNPAEVRGVLSMSRQKSRPEELPLTPAQIDFAQQLLPFRYAAFCPGAKRADKPKVSEHQTTYPNALRTTKNKLSSDNNKALLFATQESGAAYSELHMAAGERALLRLAQEIAQQEDALVLIDEVEAGLHPWVQQLQLLMLQLQQLALRNSLQVIVTTHSPVVLDSVPRHGRIFLDRDEPSGQVVVRDAYRDVIQNALYGRAQDALNLLCEDEAAEGILQGVFDVLIPREAYSESRCASDGTPAQANSLCTRRHSENSDRFKTPSSFLMETRGIATLWAKLRRRQNAPRECYSSPARARQKDGCGRSYGNSLKRIPRNSASIKADCWT